MATSRAGNGTVTGTTLAIAIAIVSAGACAKVDAVASTDAGPVDHGSASPDGKVSPPAADASPVDVGPAADALIVPVTPPRPWGGQTIDPSAPANAPTMFGGSAMQSAALNVVYPLDGSLHPVNILDVTVQWQGGTTGKSVVYRLRFTNAAGTLDVFTACAKAQCVYPMPSAAWRSMSDANRDADVTLTVSAPGNGTVVPTSAPIRIHFSPGSVAGGLYYWSTKQETIYRLTFGQRKAGPYMNSTGCHGCHTVSRDGSRIAWLDGIDSDPHTIHIAPTTALPDAKLVGPTDVPNMPALNSDGTRLLLSDGRQLSVVDSTTLAVLYAGVPDGLAADEAIRFFEWSPDGKTIVVTVGTASDSDQRPDNNLYFDHGGIALVSTDGTKFGPLRPLVPADKESSYYPSWSPDGKWIVFSTAETPIAVPYFLGTYNNPYGRLRLISASGGPIYELQKASQKRGTTTSWPKFAPFSQLGGQLLFIGFSAKADYGFLLPGSLDSNSQLWFSAIDLRRLPTGDPSWAPIWLPFQEITQSNHLPYWTEAIGCLSDPDCGPDGLCKNNQCQPTIVIP